jgi:hypothetical protein
MGGKPRVRKIRTEPQRPAASQNGIAQYSKEAADCRGDDRASRYGAPNRPIWLEASRNTTPMTTIATTISDHNESLSHRFMVKR